MTDDVGPAVPGESPAQPPGGSPAGPAGPPGEILADLAQLRRRTRRARHAYWFPLLLFGLLTLASVPLYALASGHLAPFRRGVPIAQARAVPADLSGPFLLGGRPAGMAAVYLGYYWVFALIGGFLLTWRWYSRHARKVGVQTPVRGAVVTGVAVALLVVAVPPLTARVLPWGAIGDLWVRGTVAFLIVAVGLWALAWAEHSRALAVISLAYTAAALLSALYNVANIAFRLGLPLPAALPNVLLPAAVLIAGGLGAFLTHRLRETS